MNETTGARPDGMREERPDETATGGFFRSIVDIYVDPLAVFRRIGAGLGWWQPYLLTSVIGIVIGWLSLPVNRRILELNERGMPPEQLDAMLENVDRFGWLGLLAVPIFYIAILGILAGIAHLVISIMSSDASYRKTISLLAWCGMVSILGQVIRTAVVLGRGIEAIEAEADAKISLSLAAFFPDLEGFAGAFLESIGIFEIWYYILFAFGVSLVFRTSRAKALLPVVIVWLVSVLALWAQSAFGGM